MNSFHLKIGTKVLKANQRKGAENKLAGEQVVLKLKLLVIKRYSNIIKHVRGAAERVCACFIA